MRKVISISIFYIIIIPVFAYGADKIHVQIKIGDTVVQGLLEDNPITRQLQDLSPMTIEMEDYNGSEKIGSPSGKIDLSGVKRGYTPGIETIALYAPWGNLCIFYRKAPFSDGLIYLGEITDGIDSISKLKKEFSSQWLLTLLPSPQ